MKIETANNRLSNRYVIPKKNLVPVKKVIYDNAKEFAASIDLLEKRDIYAIVSGSFIYGDFLEALITEWNIDIKEMTIATLALSQNNIDSLKHLLFTYKNIEKLNLIVSRYFYGNEIRQLIPYIYENLDHENRFQLAVCDGHWKIAQFETKKGNKIVISGSANLRASQNLEQFQIQFSDDIYNFNNEIFEIIIDKYKTIQKAIGYKNLIKLIQDVENDNSKEIINDKNF